MPTSTWHHRRLVWLTRAFIAMGLLVAWELLSIAEGGLFLPRLSDAGAAWARLASTSELWQAMWRSNQSLLVGFPIALLFGVVAGLVLGRVSGLDRYVGYYLDLLLVIPTIALVPVIIAALGLSLAARVVVVVLFSLPVIAMNARAAVRILDRARIEMARSFGASWAQVWRMVILPGATGPIFAGVRLGLSRAVSGMIVVELVLVPAGLGGLIVDFNSQFRAPELYATTALIIAEGIVLIALARSAERAIDRRMRGEHIS